MARAEDGSAAAAPRTAIFLGIAGLLPFWFLAIAHVAGIDLAARPGLVAAALATYAATILSFLGGVRWGLAVRDGSASPWLYAASVLPQLAGWAALALSERWRFLVLALLILIWGPADRRLVRQGLAPAWFGRLRLALSLGAGAALFLAAFA